LRQPGQGFVGQRQLVADRERAGGQSSRVREPLAADPRASAVGANGDIRGDSADVGEVSGDPTLGSVLVARELAAEEVLSP
jgi:hypothetical protein